MKLEDFLAHVKQNPTSITFSDTMSVIENQYAFTPSAFKNGDLLNAADENNGSCKLFAFALLNKLTPEETLACFGDYYRKDVLESPEGDSHQNIRNFMQYGWDGVDFDAFPLVVK